jgi:Anti-sigma-K factor rskA
VTDDELSELIASTLDEDAPAAPPEDRIDALRRQVTARATRSEPSPTIARRRGVWLGVAAAVVALATGLAVGRFVLGSGDTAGVAGAVEFDGAMTGADGQRADAELRVVGTGIGRVIVLRTDVLPILPTGEYYAVWFVSTRDVPDAPDRISAGTFHPDPAGRSDVQFAAAVNPALYPIVEITAEPGDGNPGPSGPVVLRATIGD